MKFIHCADVHLDTPLQGLAEYPGAPVNEIRNATRRAFEKAIRRSTWTIAHRNMPTGLLSSHIA